MGNPSCEEIVFERLCYSMRKTVSLAPPRLDLFFLNRPPNPELSNQT
jgi:hypothetical protein